MCTLPTDFGGHHWEEWNGPLTSQIDHQISSFLATLYGRTIHGHSLIINQIVVTQGGLGLLNPSARAILDFVLTLTHAARSAEYGFWVNKDLAPICLHPSICYDLYILAAPIDPIVSHNPPIPPGNFYLCRLYKHGE